MLASVDLSFFFLIRDCDRGITLCSPAAFLRVRSTCLCDDCPLQDAIPSSFRFLTSLFHLAVMDDLSFMYRWNLHPL